MLLTCFSRHRKLAPLCPRGLRCFKAQPGMAPTSAYLAPGDVSPDTMSPQASPCPLELHSSWEALRADAWVVSTMTQGYQWKFVSVPPVTRLAALSITADNQHREVLRSEISTLLAKTTIKEVGQENYLSGFYTIYFLVPKVGRHSQANCGPQGTKQVPQASKVQNVNYTHSEASYPCRRLVCNS